MQFKYIGSFPAIDAPLVGIVQAGGVVDVSDEVGAKLAEQPDVWEPVGKKGTGK